MRKILIAILIFLAAIIQVSFLPNLFPGHVAPDIMLVSAIIWSVWKNLKRAWLWIIPAGLVLDVLTFDYLGVNAISFFIISLGVSSLSKRVTADNKILIVLLYAGFIIVGTIANFLIGDILNGLNRFAVDWNGLLAETVNRNGLIQKIFFNLIVSPFIYWLIVKMKTFLRSGEII